MGYWIVPQTSTPTIATDLCPTTGRWMQKDMVGVDGDGHPVYPGVRSFELRWDLMTVADFRLLNIHYEGVKTTGSVVVGLPQWGGSTYTFVPYSGCTLEEPQAAEYFAEHLTQVVLIVRNIRT